VNNNGNRSNWEEKFALEGISLQQGYLLIEDSTKKIKEVAVRRVIMCVCVLIRICSLLFRPLIPNARSHAG